MLLDEFVMFVLVLFVTVAFVELRFDDDKEAIGSELLLDVPAA